MKNKKLIAKILLVVVLSFALLALTGCDITPNDDVNNGLASISGGFFASLIGLMYSIIIAIGSVFLGIISFIAGIFQLIGALIASIF